jgi:hypothetical protein
VTALVLAALFLVLTTVSPSIPDARAGESLSKWGTDPLAAAAALGSLDAREPVAAVAARRVVVKMVPSAGAPDLALFDLGRACALGGEGVYVLEAAPSAADEVPAIVETVRRLPGVVWAEQVPVLDACLVPNDPYYAPSGAIGQGGLPKIGMPAAWDLETGSEDVIVAVLDTGLDPDFSDFAGRVTSPYSAVLRTTLWPGWKDNHGHGTFVTGIAVAQGNNGQGMAGTAWNVKIMPVKIAEQQQADAATLAEGIYWAADHGADVINISWATSVNAAVLRDAVAYALNQGAVVVAAAGNSGVAQVSYPAALPGVLAVGSLSYAPSDMRADFSNTGSALDLMAPGTEILSRTIGTTPWIYWQGTSFSTPFVCGVAALVRSAAPDLSVAQVCDILTSTADDLGVSGWDPGYGYGRVDGYEAVVKAREATSTTTTSASSTTTSTTTTTTLPTSTTTTTTSTSTTSTTSTSTTSTTATSTTSTTAPVTRFVDVSADSSPYYVEIEELAARGIVAGKGGGYFYPHDDVTRQQFAKMIVLAMQYVVDFSDVSPFVDVVRNTGDLYPYHYVAVAWQRGITKGVSDSRFMPYASLTRAQLITMVARAAGLSEPPADYVPPFRNFSSDHFPSARQAAYAGLLDGMQGMGPGYDFFAYAAREEVCALLYALLHR